MKRTVRLLGWFAVGVMLLAAVPVFALVLTLPYQLIEGAGGLLGATGWPDGRMAFRVGVILGGLASICMLLGLAIREMDARYLASAVLAALACMLLSALSIPWDPVPPVAPGTGSTHVRDEGRNIPPPSSTGAIEHPSTRDLPPALPPGTNRPASVDAIFRHTNPPIYPAEAVKAGISGRVLLLVHVDSTGRPAQIAIERSSGNVHLDRAAMESVRRWSFNPAYVDGVPVAARIRIPVDFRLQ